MEQTLEKTDETTISEPIKKYQHIFTKGNLLRHKATGEPLKAYCGHIKVTPIDYMSSTPSPDMIICPRCFEISMEGH